LWRRACYTQAVETLDATRHESVRLWAVVAALGVPFPDELRMHIAPDPALLAQAKAYLNRVEVLCFINSSQPKREWPLSHWAEFHEMASTHGVAIGFSGGHSERERALLGELRERVPQAIVLEPAEPLEVLIAALAQLKGFISVDTGPMHFAAALGVPTIGLFGPNSAQCWAPLGTTHAWLQGSPCPCSGHVHACEARKPCIAAITPAQLYAAFLRMIGQRPDLASQPT
jgi:ADP-heptose:LPS heptosyltransferase